MMTGRRALDRDDGLSLVELIVSMMIFAVVMAATVQLAIGFERTTAETTSRQDQIDTGRAAIEAMTQTLRTAVMPRQLIGCSAELCTDNAFVQGTRYSVQFYANFKNPGNTVGPSRVTYELTRSGPDAGVLTEKIQRPDSPVPTTSGYTYCNAESSTASSACRARLVSHVLARGVLSNTGTPLFGYFDRDGDEIDPGSGGLGVEQLARIVAVDVVVTTQQDNATKAKPTTYIQRVTLPNAQAVLRQENQKDETP